MKIKLQSTQRSCHCGAAKVDYQTSQALEKGFRRLHFSSSTNALRRHLNKAVFTKLQYQSTPLGSTLWDVVKTGLTNHRAPIGVLAPDEYAYDVYKCLFDSILEERHYGFLPTERQPPVNWGKWQRIDNVDWRNKYITSVRIRVARNLRGYPFAPTMKKDDFRQVEQKIVQTLYNLPGNIKGMYVPLQCLTQDRTKTLEKHHCLFEPREMNEFNVVICRFWPTGRGVFFTPDHSLAAWVNEKDHLRVVSLEKGGDLQSAYRRVATLMPSLDRALNAARHARLGFLTVSLGNAGTALHASAHVKLPGVPQAELDRVAKVYHMEIRSMDPQRYLYYVGNRRRLGYTEYEIMKEFNLGVRELMFMISYYEMMTGKVYDVDEENDDERAEQKDKRKEKVIGTEVKTKQKKKELLYKGDDVGKSKKRDLEEDVRREWKREEKVLNKDEEKQEEIGERKFARGKSWDEVTMKTMEDNKIMESSNWQSGRQSRSYVKSASYTRDTAERPSIRLFSAPEGRRRSVDLERGSKRLSAFKLSRHHSKGQNAEQRNISSIGDHQKRSSQRGKNIQKASESERRKTAEEIREEEEKFESELQTILGENPVE